MAKLYVLDIESKNWDEITLRARRVIDEAVLVVGNEEAGVWLSEAGIHASLVVPEGSGALAAVLGALSEGDVAWLSFGLAEGKALLRALLARGVEVLPVPGGSPIIAGLVASGLPCVRFSYLGVLPGFADARRAVLKEMMCEPYTLVCDVRGADLRAVLQDVWNVLGDRRIALWDGRRICQGQVSEGGTWVETIPCVAADWLFIEGMGEAPSWTEDRLRREARDLLSRGKTSRDVARVLTARSGWRKKAVYAIVVEISKE
jgi:16S rRNA C1402 (ribose-2'-O) methylase RsmI